MRFGAKDLKGVERVGTNRRAGAAGAKGDGATLCVCVLRERRGSRALPAKVRFEVGAENGREGRAALEVAGRMKKAARCDYPQSCLPREPA